MPPQGQREHGFTLVELLLVVVMTGLIVTAVASALTVGLRSTDQAGSRLSESIDTQLLAAYWPQDVQSAGTNASDVDTSAGATAGCSGLTGTNVVALKGTDPVTSQSTGVSYRLESDGAGANLVRFACMGGGTADRRITARSLAAAGGATAATSGAQVSIKLTMALSSASDSPYTTTVTAYRRAAYGTGTSAGGSPCALAGTPALSPTTSVAALGVLLTPPTLTVSTTGSCGQLLVRYAAGIDPLSTRDQTLTAAGGTHTVTLTADGWAAGAHPLSVYDGAGALLNSPNFVVTDAPTCTVSGLSASPTSGTRLGNGSLVEGAVTVTATTESTCGPLTLAYDPGSEATDPTAASAAFTLAGTSRTATIPSSTSWSAGTHTLQVRDATGAVLRSTSFVVVGCTVSAVTTTPTQATREVKKNGTAVLTENVVVTLGTTGTCADLRVRFQPGATVVTMDMLPPGGNRSSWTYVIGKNDHDDWSGADNALAVLDASGSVLAQRTLVVE